MARADGSSVRHLHFYKARQCRLVLVLYGSARDEDFMYTAGQHDSCLTATSRLATLVNDTASKRGEVQNQRRSPSHRQSGDDGLISRHDAITSNAPAASGVGVC